jgi:hypothetical protein
MWPWCGALVRHRVSSPTRRQSFVCALAPVWSGSVCVCVFSRVSVEIICRKADVVATNGACVCVYGVWDESLRREKKKKNFFHYLVLYQFTQAV